jgi:hypothetical protein
METDPLSVFHESLEHFKVKAALVLDQLLVQSLDVWSRFQKLDESAKILELEPTIFICVC